MVKQEVNQYLNELNSNDILAELLVYPDTKQLNDQFYLSKLACGLSNEANLRGFQFGIIVFEDSKESFLNELVNELNLRLQPVEIKQVKGVQLDNNKCDLMLVQAAFQGLPTSVNGHFFGLENSIPVPLSFEKFDFIRFVQGRRDWTNEICSSAEIKDLDLMALKKARIGFKSRYLHLEKEIETWSEIEFLNKVGLAKGDKLTNSAVLLLGKEGSEHLLSPVNPMISWTVKDANNIEKGFQHFGLPFILQIDQILGKINNLKYDFATDTDFASVETTKYDPKVLNELVINAIAHSDYQKQGRITITELPDRLLIENPGGFIPGSIDKVLQEASQPLYYRNNSLTRVMHKINLIDLIGSGIKKIIKIQKERKFPLPDVEVTPLNSVISTLYGKVINKNYTEKLIANPNLSIYEVYLLDRVQKEKRVSEEEANLLRNKKLVTGRYPDLTVASKFTMKEGEKPVFAKKRVYSKDELKDLLINHLEKNKEAGRQEIDDLLIDKLPEGLNEQKQRNKIKNLLYEMSRVDNTIKNEGSSTKPIWVKS